MEHDSVSSPPLFRTFCRRFRIQAPAVGGVALALLAYSLFTFSDACVRLLNGRVNSSELGFFGILWALPILPFVKSSGDRYLDLFRTTRRSVWLLRTFCVALCIACSVVAFTHLPMPEALSLIFLMPFFVTLLSVLMLGEHVSLGRWISVLLGFAGVLVILRPGFRALNIGHLAALMVGFSAALSVVAYRLVDHGEKRISLFGTCLIGPLVVNGLLMIPGFAWPQAGDLPFIAGYGLLAAVAQLLLMAAARRCSANRLAAPQYIQMLWGVALSYVLFHEPMDGVTALGVAVIVGAGLIPWIQIRLGERRRTSVPCSFGEEAAKELP